MLITFFDKPIPVDRRHAVLDLKVDGIEGKCVVDTCNSGPGWGPTRWRGRTAEGWVATRPPKHGRTPMEESQTQGPSVGNESKSQAVRKAFLILKTYYKSTTPPAS